MKVEQTVFVVDDEPAVAKAVSRLLRASGYAVKAFPSAQAFMDSYKPDAGGCLVLDLAMPGITGLELMKWLAERGYALPILFLTGTADIPEKTRAMMMEGAVDILTKPVNGNVLLKGVEEALARDLEVRKG